MITAALICKNEIEYLPYSLAMPLKYADKLVIVFTAKEADRNFVETRDYLFDLQNTYPKVMVIEHTWTGCHATARRQYVPHLENGWFWHLDADEIWYENMVKAAINYLPTAKADYLNINMKHFKNTHFTCGHRYMQRVRWVRIDRSKYHYDIAGSHIADDLIRVPKNGPPIRENMMPAFGDPGTSVEFAGLEDRLAILHFTECNKLKFDDKQIGKQWPNKELLVAFPGPYPSQCEGAPWLENAGVSFGDDPPHYLIDPYFKEYQWNAKNVRWEN